MKVVSLNLDQVVKVREVCSMCPEWKGSRTEGFNTCHRYHTDSSIFRVEWCDDLAEQVGLTQKDV